MQLTRPQEAIALEAAQFVMSEGVKRANEPGMRVSICVTDTTGGIVALVRTDGAHAGTTNAARGKAFYSARSGRSTEDFVRTRLQNDEVLWRAVSQNSETFLVPGGEPLIADGTTVGGVGISGGNYNDDVKVAAATREAFEAAVRDHGTARST